VKGSKVMSESQSPINTNAVAAVRMADGWHEGITGFEFYGGEGVRSNIQQSGATWTEKGRRFTCPLNAVLTVREGPPLEKPPSPIEQKRDRSLQRATEWLQKELQNGPRPTKQLIQDARDRENFSRPTLFQAAKAMHIDTRGVCAGVPVWSLVPLHNVTEHTTTDAEMDAPMVF
jgi:hypothetical protein